MFTVTVILESSFSLLFYIDEKDVCIMRRGIFRGMKIKVKEALRSTGSVLFPGDIGIQRSNVLETFFSSLINGIGFT